MKIELKQINDNMNEPEYQMLQGILGVENGFTNPAYNLSYAEYKNWLREEADHSRGIGLPVGWKPYTTYILYIDDSPVGYGRIRHSSDEYLETIVGAGNLGYGISKEYRGKGYGNILFQELLKKCKELGYNEIKLFPVISWLPNYSEQKPSNSLQCMNIFKLVPTYEVAKCLCLLLLM